MKQTKPVSAATRAMLDAMEQDAAAPAEGDKLDRAKKLVAELRDAELEKARIEESLRAVNIQINDLLWSKIPALMDEAMLDDLTISADGNKPPYSIKIDDYYRANIPEEHAEAAFAHLRKTKNGDLIKQTFTVGFGRGEEKRAMAFAKSLEKAGIEYSAKQAVPWNTLTAWFKAEYRGKDGPKKFPTKVMEILGAKVGRVATVVKQKEKK